jgi:hypothetical protein
MSEVVPEPIAMPPDEEAAMKFTKLLPFVTKLGDALQSKGGLVRVLRAVAEFPIGGREPRLLNDGERQLFHIMMELNGYKSTVVNSIMKKNAELEQLKQTATAMAPVAESEVNG